MFHKIFLFNLFLVGALVVNAQNSISYEQIALNYLVDNILEKGKHKKRFGLQTIVEEEPSMFQTRFCFENYVSTIGDPSNPELEKERLEYLKSPSELLINPSKKKFYILSEKRKKNLLKKKNRKARVLKANILIKGFHFIEIILTEKETRWHYFIEVNSKSKEVVRWCRTISMS